MIVCGFYLSFYRIKFSGVFQYKPAFWCANIYYHLFQFGSCFFKQLPNNFAVEIGFLFGVPSNRTGNNKNIEQAVDDVLESVSKDALSKSMLYLIRSRKLHRTNSLLDYGCGHGFEWQYLRSLGGNGY